MTSDDIDNPAIIQKYVVIQLGRWYKKTIDSAGRVEVFDRIKLKGHNTPLCYKSTNYYDPYEKRMDQLHSIIVSFLAVYLIYMISYVFFMFYHIFFH